MLWQTREGGTIDVVDMSDAHLANSIAYMKRRLATMYKGENSMWGGYSFLQGEQAQYAAEQCLDQVAEDISDAEYSLRGLEAEKNRRDRNPRMEKDNRR
jgi:hypothetical protein